MSRKVAATDQVVKLIVGAGGATPSPPVGPALGSKGVKAIDFCKVDNPSFQIVNVSSSLSLGIQCSNRPHHPWDPHTRPSHGSTRPLLHL